MKKKLLSIALLFSTVLTFSSCLGSDDDYTYTDDAAITSFSLGTLKRYITTKASDGVTDSTYKTTYSASSYAFNIDQVSGKIYNTDSLRVYTDASKVICSISTKNSGNVAIKSMTSDSLTWYTSTDSIDFTKPRVFVVYSNSGTATRSYTVTVNVHQEDSLAFKMTAVTVAAPFSSLTAMKAVRLNNDIYLFGTNGSVAKAYKSTNGTVWTEIIGVSSLSAYAYKNIVTKGGYIYTLSNGTVVRSSDGSSWQKMNNNVSLSQLVVGGNGNLFGMTSSAIYTSADGASWTKETLDESSALLPTENVSGACFASKTNAYTDRIVIVGNRSASYDDNYAQVWGKIDEYSNGSDNQPWNYYPHDNDDKYLLPVMKNMQVISYGNEMLAIGTDSANIYHSKDQGITWKTGSTYVLPDAFLSSNAPFAVIEGNNSNIWLIRGSKVWVGRINYIAWGETK